ncbi:MAG: Na+ ABC transporter permease [Fimbriimonadales bacterium]|nr:MAG: Na+ ABC transporter permease [Fimbriimonadales bacterium]
MKAWLTVLLKELREFTRDKRVLGTSLLGPFFLEFILILGIGGVEQAMEKPKAHKIAVVNRAEAEPVLTVLEASGQFEVTDAAPDASISDILKEKKARVVLEFPKGFADAYRARRAPEFIAYYDPNETISRVALTMVRATVQQQAQLEEQLRMRALGLDPQAFEAYRMKEEAAPTGQAAAATWLVSFLPYLIVLWSFYGGFSIVADLVAGEKERGSLETLLVSPIPRSSIAIGKFLALSCVAFASATSALLGVVAIGLLPIPAAKQIFEGGGGITVLQAAAVLLTLVPLVLFFSGLLLAVSTFSRNMREANGYLGWLSFVVLVPAIASQFIGFTDLASSPILPFIPILNSATVLRDALMDNLDLYRFAVTFLITVGLAIGGILLSVRLFQKESVLLRM